MKKIRIGTRGSRLALWQASLIETELMQHHPGIHIERVIIKTQGDSDQRSGLSEIGGQGVFTKALEESLLNGTIDIAVHSLKDLPTKMADGLSLAAVPARGPAEDVLITDDGRSLDMLPGDAVVATGSTRRRSQLLNLRRDLRIADLRGNIDTRLKKLQEEGFDAIMMARAALVRLKIDHMRCYTFSVNEMIPSPGQGAVAAQVRADDKVSRELTHCLDNPATHQAVLAERTFLHELDCGCQFPVGAFAEVLDDTLEITGFVGSEDGRSIFKDKLTASSNTPQDAGKSLADRLLERGAGRLLERFRNG